ncbi:MAG: carbohydrate ABC transporter permease [Eubacteriales bacterium]|jgi:multiple sugar transport system permease protein|nr:carbohydrate ABC transporter permease [Eubacteriales bacterium]
MLNKNAGLITSLDYKRTGTKLLYWIMFALCVFILIISLFPLIWALLSSFKTVNEFYQIPPSLFPEKLDFAVAKEVLARINVLQKILNSLIIFLGSWIVTIFFSGLAGYVISKVRPKGAKLLFNLILWSMMMPPSVNMVPLFILFLKMPLTGVNITNTYLPLWIIAAAECFNILLFKTFFDSIPNSYVESAKIDGCSDVGIFFRIIVPLSLPIIATISVFTFNASWNSFLWPMILLTKPEIQPLAVALYRMLVTYSIPEQMLVGMVAILPPLIVFFLFQKVITENSISVGIKG